MCECKTPLAVAAAEVPSRTKPSNYPEPFFSRTARREKRPLGDLFSLENFGVNLTTLEPGGETALMHSHSKQDEMIYILQGTLVDRQLIANQRGRGYFASEDAVARALTEMKEEFMREELPKIIRTMRLLGIGPERIAARFSRDLQDKPEGSSP